MNTVYDKLVRFNRQYAGCPMWNEAQALLAEAEAALAAPPAGRHATGQVHEPWSGDDALDAARATFTDDATEAVITALQAGVSPAEIRTDFDAMLSLHEGE